jgi:hypothetical protein
VTGIACGWLHTCRSQGKACPTNPPKRIDLSARVISKPDLDNPDVKTLLFPDLDKYLK